MSRSTTRVRAGNDRASFYTEITDKIIAELEAGRIPWVQPWGTSAIKAPLARPESQKANLDALRISLDDEDRAAIAALPKDQRFVRPPFAPEWDAVV